MSKHPSDSTCLSAQYTLVDPNLKVEKRTEFSVHNAEHGSVHLGPASLAFTVLGLER